MAVEIKRRNVSAVEDLISAIASCYGEQEAIKQIFKPLLAIFTVEDREWFDELRKNASWL